MKSCTQCGSVLSSESPQGLCARCLLNVALASETSDFAPTESAYPTTASPEATLASGADRAAGPVIDIANPAVVAARLPQFEILELLGRGGMGVVYKARQVQLDRIVALKILPSADAQMPNFVERFRREARSLAKLSHPNIVHLYEFGESGGLFYFVMEHVDGANLRQVMQSGKMTPAEALMIVPRICDALQFAHEDGVVHRDIKPENILIDKRGRVKIADFGLAKLLDRPEIDPRLTVTGAALGTPRYMAPEQLDAPQNVDHRADIYSLGVVFYEMLTGEVPMGRFQPPSQKVQIDVRFDEIVLHALEHDVERRYQHVTEVREDVEQVTRSAAATPQGVALPSATAAAGTSPTAAVTAAPPLPSGRSRLAAFFRCEPQRWWLIGASAALYVASLFLPAAYFPDILGGMDGAACFDCVRRSGNAIWLANPLLWLAWVLMSFRLRWLAFIASVLSAVLCLWVVIDRAEVTPTFSINGGPAVPMRQPHLLSGYACWLGSAAVFAAGALYLALSRRQLQSVIGDRPANAIRVDVAAGESADLPRLSRQALWGAIWAPLFFIALAAVLIHFIVSLPASFLLTGSVDWLWILLTPLLLGGVLAPFGTTILGGLAIASIRRSGGHLYGLRLATADLLLFPLLALDFAIMTAIAAIVMGILAAMYPHGPGSHTALAQVLPMILVLSISLPLSAWIDLRIIRRVWRMVTARPA